MSDAKARFLGGIMGAAIAIYFLMYLPMKSNYEECGKITLCNVSDSEQLSEDNE